MHSLNIAWIKSDGLPVAINSAFQLIPDAMSVFVPLDIPKLRILKIQFLISQLGVGLNIVATYIDLDNSLVIFQTDKWIFNILQVVLFNLPQHILFSFLL